MLKKWHCNCDVTWSLCREKIGVPDEAAIRDEACVVNVKIT